jgi:hypothetical protein
MPQGWYAPSEDDLAAQTDYDVLPEDEYIAKIISVEIKPDVMNKYPSKGDMEPKHDMLVVKFEALSFVNGDPLVDTDDQDIEGTVPFQAMLNPKKVGMIPQPSKTRKFFAAALGQPVGDTIKIDDWSQLAGKTLIVSLKPNNGYNNPQDFRALRKSRTRGTTTKGPVDTTDLVEKAREIFDEDAPANVSPNPAFADADNADDLDF